MFGKIALCAALTVALGAVSFAATQYDIDVEKDGFNFKSSSLNGYSITALKDSGLTFSTDLSHSNNHAPKTWGGLAEAHNYRDVGYFTFSGSTITGMETLNFNSDGKAFASFNAGDQIGFWVKTLEGNTVYSMKFVTNESGYRNVFNGRDSYNWNDASQSYESRVFLFSNGAAGGDVLAVTLGQPLPGLLATLLFGSGTLSLGFLRKRRNAAVV